MAYTSIYTQADRAALASAIKTLATRSAARVMIDGRMVDYKREDITFMRQLLNDMEIDIAKGSDNGGMSLIKPGGRT